jgi:hypothetical protein
MQAILVGTGALLVPVPLHPWRQWSRGFNQADDIARALASTLGASRSCTRFDAHGIRVRSPTSTPTPAVATSAALSRSLAGRRGRVAAGPVASRIGMSCSSMT